MGNLRYEIKESGRKEKQREKKIGREGKEERRKKRSEEEKAKKEDRKQMMK